MIEASYTPDLTEVTTELNGAVMPDHESLPITREITPLEGFMMTQALLVTSLAIGAYALVTTKVGNGIFKTNVEYDDDNSLEVQAIQNTSKTNIHHNTVLVLEHLEYYRSVLYKGKDKVFRFVRNLVYVSHATYNKVAEKGFPQKPKK